MANYMDIQYVYTHSYGTPLILCLLHLPPYLSYPFITGPKDKSKININSQQNNRNHNRHHPNHY